MNWLERRAPLSPGMLNAYLARHPTQVRSADERTWESVGSTWTGSAFTVTLFSPVDGVYLAQARIIDYGNVQASDAVKLGAVEYALRRLSNFELSPAIALQDNDLLVKADNPKVTAPEQALRLINDVIDVYAAIAPDVIDRLGVEEG